MPLRVNPRLVASSQGKAPFTVAATLHSGGSSTFEGFVCAISTLLVQKFVAVGLDSSTKLWCSISTDFRQYLDLTILSLMESGGEALHVLCYHQQWLFPASMLGPL